MRKIYIVSFLSCFFLSCTENFENLNISNDETPQTRAMARIAPGEVYTGWHYGYDYDPGFQTKVYSVKFTQATSNVTGLSSTFLYNCHKFPGSYTVTFDPELWEFSPAPSPECGYKPDLDGNDPEHRGYTYKIIEPGKVELSTYVYYVSEEAHDLKPWWNVFVPCRRHEVLFRWYLTRLK